MVSDQCATGRPCSKPRSAPQIRILKAARDLFGEHGVSGTSLQMIADAVGVTKAAVYRQFKTKDAIIVAVTELQLARFVDALEAAEAKENRSRVRELLFNQVIDMVVEERRMIGMLHTDPVLIRLLAEHQPFQLFIERLNRALIGDATNPESLVQAAMLLGAISGAVTHPLVTHLDDAMLRSQLMRLTRRLTDRPE